jgi:hypothetical protein
MLLKLFIINKKITTVIASLLLALSGWIRNLGLTINSQVLYQCATVVTRYLNERWAHSYSFSMSHWSLD